MTPLLTIEQIFVSIAIFLILSIIASKVAVRIGVPALLLFLLLGMLAGGEGIGRIEFDNAWLTQAVGVTALALILFSGGLDTSWRKVRPVLTPALLLSTVGVSITALAVGLFAVVLLQFSLVEGVLLGAIIASTDAAAVFAVLRGKSVQLKGHMTPLLELESGSNDPMAVFLTLGMTQLVANPETSPATLIPLFFVQMGVGLVAGVASGRGMAMVLNRIRLDYDGLYPVLSLTLALLTYGITTVLSGNGFLAVYVAGLVLSQQDFVHRRSLVSFHDGLAWLMQIMMFVTLGLQVFVSRLAAVALPGLIVALFLILVARPLSVFVALAFSRFQIREKLFVSWVGLRGAAPIVMATFPLLAGIERADTIFHLVFFIVLTSVLLQGTLIVQMAKWLGIYNDNPSTRQSPLAFVMNDGVISNNLIEIGVSEDAPAVGSQIVDLHLPDDVLIVLIGRGGDLVVPRGDTIITAGDEVLFLTREQEKPYLLQQFQGQK
jgi:potassium/hydrogen antiporter